MALRFLWNPRKTASNVRKHGVDFPEATTVFDDSLSVTIADSDHSEDEERFLSLGLSNRRRLLVVAHARAGRVDPHNQRAASKSPGETNL
jgi:uncharacterized protein